jgi:hypothetical protein
MSSFLFLPHTLIRERETQLHYFSNFLQLFSLLISKLFETKTVSIMYTSLFIKCRLEALSGDDSRKAIEFE